MKALTLIITTILLSFIISPSLSAQFYFQQLKYNDYKGTYVDKYSKQLERRENITRSGYHYVVTQTTDSKNYIRVFYPETEQIVSHEQYETEDCISRSGYAKYWYENGNMLSEGYYKNNERVGQWKLYNHEDGSLSSSGIYKSGKKNGVWTSFENGNTSAIHTYKEDSKEGPFIEYNPDGSISNQGAYQGDIIFSQNKMSSDDLEIENEPIYRNRTCDQLSTYKERAECAEKVMLEKIYATLRYPLAARDHGIQGQVILQLTINTKGYIEDIEVITGICDELKNESIRAVNTLKNWNPATKNGEPVESKIILPINFKIENR